MARSPTVVTVGDVAPYVAFLYTHTGHLRLEGKSNINYTIAQRVRSEMTHTEAAYGLDHLGQIEEAANKLPFHRHSHASHDRPTLFVLVFMATNGNALKAL